jgi:hypothetical protein
MKPNNRILSYDLIFLDKIPNNLILSYLIFLGTE